VEKEELNRVSSPGISSVDQNNFVQKRNVLSIDLAHARYDDNGIVFLEEGSAEPRCILPSTLGLNGKPEIFEFALALEEFCCENRVSVLMLDGPQGWRYPLSQIQHMRLCERVLNTPGKTGIVGQVKPRTYLGYIQFSIDLFTELRVNHGWDLLTRDWYRSPFKRWLVESFPTAAWKTLGLSPLPAKSKTTQKDLVLWRAQFIRQTGWHVQDQITHDQLQAAVVIPAGQSIALRQASEVLLAGVDPFLDEEGHVLEGLIPLPVKTPV
jgi:hypothetical protein